jgi:hypothetical protein
MIINTETAMRKTVAAIFSLFILSLNTFGQANIQYLKEEKTIYNIGDTIQLLIQIKAPEETCMDGMKTTKLFQKGISMISQSEWEEIKKGFWQKEISLVIKGNKNKEATLTIFRRNDKQSISQQEKFRYNP